VAGGHFCTSEGSLKDEAQYEPSDGLLIIHLLSAADDRRVIKFIKILLT